MHVNVEELNALELARQMSELIAQKRDLELKIKTVELQMHDVSEKLCWASGACSGSGRVSP